MPSFRGALPQLEIPLKPFPDFVQALPPATISIDPSGYPDCERRHASPRLTSPTSSDSTSHEDRFHSDAEPLRHCDSAYIARPRNAFIIFRCEYSREHSREGKRIRRPPGSLPIEKTLSKKAAEAWHQLSPQEKDVYNERARKEKEEHAILYPDYRFNPMRRNSTSGPAGVPKKRSPQAPPARSLPPPPKAESPIAAPSPPHSTLQTEPLSPEAAVDVVTSRPLIPVDCSRFTDGDQEPLLLTQVEPAPPPYTARTPDISTYEEDWPSVGYFSPEGSFGVTSSETWQPQPCLWSLDLSPSTGPYSTLAGWNGESPQPVLPAASCDQLASFIFPELGPPLPGYADSTGFLDDLYPPGQPGFLDPFAYDTTTAGGGASPAGLDWMYPASSSQDVGDFPQQFVSGQSEGIYSGTLDCFNRCPSLPVVRSDMAHASSSVDPASDIIGTEGYPMSAAAAPPRTRPR